MRRAGRLDAQSIFVRRIAVALAVLAVAIPALAARADAFVYWSLNPRAGEGSIGRANHLTGSVLNFLFLQNLSGAQGIAVDSTHGFLYWANGPDQIGRVALNGTGAPGTPDPNFIVFTGTPTTLAVDSTPRCEPRTRATAKRPATASAPTSMRPRPRAGRNSLRLGPRG